MLRYGAVYVAISSPPLPCPPPRSENPGSLEQGEHSTAVAVNTAQSRVKTHTHNTSKDIENHSTHLQCLNQVSSLKLNKHSV
jgi:hypothetical protein